MNITAAIVYLEYKIFARILMRSLIFLASKKYKLFGFGFG